MPLDAPFIQRAIVEALLLAGLAGVLGSWIVLRRFAFFTHGVGTAAFPGLVLAGPAGVAPQLTALAASLAYAGGVEGLRRRRVATDAAAGLVLVGALALGVVVVGVTPVTATAADPAAASDTGGDRPGNHEPVAPAPVAPTRQAPAPAPARQAPAPSTTTAPQPVTPKRTSMPKHRAPAPPKTKATPTTGSSFDPAEIVGDWNEAFLDMLPKDMANEFRKFLHPPA